MEIEGNMTYEIEHQFNTWDPNDWQAYSDEVGVTMLMHEVNRGLDRVNELVAENDRLRAIILELQPWVEHLNEWR